MHAILHPDCLGRITTALSLDPSDCRLEIPEFFLVDREKDVRPPSDRLRAPDLLDSEMAAVARHLSDEAARRRPSSAGLFRVLVDGTERARLDLETTPIIRIEVESGAELIEVRRRESNGDVLLAVHLLQDRPIETATVFEGGRKISFSVTPVRRGGETVLAVEIVCRQSNPARIFSSALQQLFFGKPGTPSFRPAPGLVVLVLAVAGLGLFLLRPRQAEAPQIAGRANPSTPARIPVSPSPADILASARAPDVPSPSLAPRTREKERLSPATPEERIARRPSNDSAEPPEPERETVLEGTRAARSVPAAASLQGVKLVYVEVQGEEPPSQRMRELLIRHLRASRRLRVADTRDEADAILRASWDVSGGAAARLVNGSGQVLWPLARGRRKETYQGSPDESAAALVRALLRDLGSAEPRP
jgi:hypothetical protein